MRILNSMATPSDRSDELLAEALRLPTKDRARIAAELIASVDDGADTDAAEAWATEIERRIRSIDQHGSRGEDWSVVRARIEQKLRSR